MPWVRFCAEESTRNPGGDIYFLPIPLCLECAKFAYNLIVCTSHFFRFLKNFPCQREKCPSRQQKRLFLEFSTQKIVFCLINSVTSEYWVWVRERISNFFVSNHFLHAALSRIPAPGAYTDKISCWSERLKIRLKLIRKWFQINLLIRIIP